MPKQTFLNLPGEKRERIFNAALDELYEYTLAGFSISRFVERAKIAKGSFYQYFEDKSDVCYYVLSRFQEHKIAGIEKELSRAGELPLFPLIRKVIDVTADMIATQPKLTAVALDIEANKEKNLSLYQRLCALVPYNTEQFYLDIIDKKKALGELDPQIDSSLLAALLTDLTVYWNNSIDRDHPQACLDRICQELDSLEYILRNGILSKEASAPQKTAPSEQEYK